MVMAMVMAVVRVEVRHTFLLLFVKKTRLHFFSSQLAFKFPNEWLNLFIPPTPSHNRKQLKCLT